MGGGGNIDLTHIHKSNKLTLDFWETTFTFHKEAFLCWSEEG